MVSNSRTRMIPRGDQNGPRRAQEQGLLDHELDDRRASGTGSPDGSYCESRCSRVTWLWLSVPWYIDPVFRLVNRVRTSSYSLVFNGM